MQDTHLWAGSPFSRALMADEIDLVSGGNAVAIAVVAGLLIGGTLYFGYQAYKAADQLVQDANKKDAKAPG